MPDTIIHDMLMVLTPSAQRGIILRMSDDDKLMAELKAEAEHWKALARAAPPPAPSAPMDPTLGADALYLRQLGGMTAGEFLKRVLVGEIDATPVQLTAAKIIIAYESRQPSARVETSVAMDAGAAAVLQAIRSGMTEAETQRLLEDIDSTAGVVITPDDDSIETRH